MHNRAAETRMTLSTAGTAIGTGTCELNNATNALSLHTTAFGQLGQLQDALHDVYVLHISCSQQRSNQKLHHHSPTRTWDECTGSTWLKAGSTWLEEGSL